MQDQTHSGRAPAIVFANAKGGVGKSTLAFLTTLYLAANGKRIAFLDLDNQKTGEACLARYAEGDWITLCDGEAALSHPAAMQGGSYDPTVGCADTPADFIVVDTPAGTDAGNLAFLQPADMLLVPCSESDLDIAATRRFVSNLLTHVPGWRGSGDPPRPAAFDLDAPRPSLSVVPNLIETEAGFYRVKSEISAIPAMPSVRYAAGIRRALQTSREDLDAVETLRSNDAFFRKLLAWAVQTDIARNRWTEERRYARVASA